MSAVAFHPNAHTQRELASLLSSGPARSMTDAARELGVSISNVTKSLARMQCAGVEVRFLDEGEPESTSRLQLVYPRRTCAVEGCGTILRRTNPSDRCELHGGGFLEPPERRPVARGRDGRSEVDWRALRLLSGLSLRETAARAGVSSSCLSRVETGERQASAQLAERLATVLLNDDADRPRRIPAPTGPRR